MVTSVHGGGRRRGFFAGCGSALDRRALQADPAVFSHLLERAMIEHEETIKREHRFEDFLDEAISLALDTYAGRRLDRALLIIAGQAERLMHRLFGEVAWTSFLGAEDLEPDPSTELWRSRELIEDHLALATTSR